MVGRISEAEGKKQNQAEWSLDRYMNIPSSLNREASPVTKRPFYSCVSHDRRLIASGWSYAINLSILRKKASLLVATPHSVLYCISLLVRIAALHMFCLEWRRFAAIRMRGCLPYPCSESPKLSRLSEDNRASQTIARDRRQLPVSCLGPAKN